MRCNKNEHFLVIESELWSYNTSDHEGRETMLRDARKVACKKYLEGQLAAIEHGLLKRICRLLQVGLCAFSRAQQVVEHFGEKSLANLGLDEIFPCNVHSDVVSVNVLFTQLPYPHRH